VLNGGLDTIDSGFGHGAILGGHLHPERGALLRSSQPYHAALIGGGNIRAVDAT
jgi:hypothetical protein